MSFLATVRRTAWTLAQFGPSRASPAGIRRRQEARLRRLVRHAATRSPFYRNLYRGIDPDRFTLADLPTTTKAELMDQFDRVVTDPAVRRADLEAFVDDPSNVGQLFRGYPVCHTSGSQGQPMLVVNDWLALDLLFAFQMTRGNIGYVRRGVVEAARRLVRPARLAVIVSRPGFFPSAWVWSHLPESMRGYIQTLYMTGNDPELVPKLAAFRPTALTGTPTMLDLLATRPDRPAMPELEQVTANSEMVTDAARGRIAAAFGVPVFDNYACGECLFLSNGCPTHPGAHVNADWAILEVVDADNRPVPPGVLGHKVLLTNLANYTQPLIRYEVGDRVMMATGPCGCGSRLPRLERVVGRVAEVFKVRVGGELRTLASSPFQQSLEHFRGVREWQAVQQGENRVVVRLEPLPGAVLDLPRMRAKLDERLGYAGFTGALDVEFEVVPELTIDPRTGKFRRMVSATAGHPEFGAVAQPVAAGTA